MHSNEEPLCVHRIQENSADLKLRGYHHDKVGLLQAMMRFAGAKGAVKRNGAGVFERRGA